MCKGAKNNPRQQYWTGNSNCNVSFISHQSDVAQFCHPVRVSRCYEIEIHFVCSCTLRCLNSSHQQSQSCICGGWTRSLRLLWRWAEVMEIFAKVAACVGKLGNLTVKCSWQMKDWINHFRECDELLWVNAIVIDNWLHVWQTMANEYTKDMALALCNVVGRHLQEAEQARQHGTIHW